MIAVDLDTNTATCGGQSVRATRQQAVILHALAAGEVVTHDAMIRAIHGLCEPEWAYNAVKVQVTRLRRLLSPLGLRIEGVWGVGWRLCVAGDDEAGMASGDGVVLHPVHNRARINGRPVRLQPIQARILRHLTARDVADRASLIARAWEGIDQPERVENALHAQISTLRRRLAPYGVAIHNRHGAGYVLVANSGGAR